jgi:DNA-binding CsgD family transcriptional regulator
LTRLAGGHDEAIPTHPVRRRGRAGAPELEPDDGDFNEPPGVAPPLAARIAPLKPPALLEQLTPRERELLAVVARGPSNAESAQRSSVTEPTVNSRVGTGPIKLGLRDTVEAVALAYASSPATAAKPRVRRRVAGIASGSTRPPATTAWDDERGMRSQGPSRPDSPP